MERSASDWLAEGDAHYDARRWNEAGIAFERTLALDGAQAHAWYRLGNVREELGRDADAAQCFERAVALDPAHAQAWNNLGGARQRLGDPEAAAGAYVRSIEADSRLAQPRLNLGRLYTSQGRHALAADCFRAGLAQHPEDPTFAHLAAAAIGESTARAPQGYVTALFDRIAPQFEQHLVRDLGYRVPEALVERVRPALEDWRRKALPVRVVDLGCGTGLIGAALAGSGAEVVGVDLSPRMLEIAAARGAYVRLEQGELVEVLLRSAPASVQAVLAADVFIYVGDLEATFRAVARALAPGGLFAFSVEALAEGDYRLLPSGRYAQSPAYLRELGAAAGLAERLLERAPIRREGAGYAEGWLALFARPASG